MDEALEKFLEEQKTKLAEEKACLEQELPYMEMRRRTRHGLQKENVPPSTKQQDGVSLPLGEEYERKKHRLQEELRNDYRKYMAEKDPWVVGDFHNIQEKRKPRTVRVRDVATLTDVCGLGWGLCSSEEDGTDEELILLQGHRHQRGRETRKTNRREELYPEMGHLRNKLHHRNRMAASVATQANERTESVASPDTEYTTGLRIGATDLDAMLQRRKEKYRRELQEQITEKRYLRRRERELDQRVLRVPETEKKLFASEEPAHRQQARDEIIRLETAEPPELQYRTISLSPYRMPTHTYKSANETEGLLSPTRAYGPVGGALFPTSSREQQSLSLHSDHNHNRSSNRLRCPGENEGRVPQNKLSYKEELTKQIEERAAKKREEMEEKRRLDAELEAEMKAYEPWGRGGAGAPIRDSTGNLIADLKQMHLLNAAGTIQRPERTGYVETQSPQFARGNVFNQAASPHQILEQDQYKAYLKQQMEEKRRKQVEEKERMRLEEEKEERRLAEQREKIRREYEEEQETRKRREIEQKLKNEELARLAEERKREAERKKKEEDEKERAALRRQEEQERQIRQARVQRAPSPPIPTLQNKHHKPSNPVDFSAFPALSPDHSKQDRTEKDRNKLVNELCLLRRRLRSEQRRLEEQLMQANLESPFTNRPRGGQDAFDMARLRMPVRGPSSRGTEPVTSKGSNDILFEDAFMVLPRARQLKNRDVEGGRGSVLLSEREFINDPNGGVFPVPPDTERKSEKLSARERRRRANLETEEVHQHQSTNSKKPRDINVVRMKRLKDFNQRTVTTGCSDEDEGAEGDQRFAMLSARSEAWVRAESSESLRRLMSVTEL